MTTEPSAMSRPVVALTALVLAAAPLNALAEDANGPAQESPAEVKPAHVFSRVALLRAELELVRAHLDAPLEQRPELDIRGAAPREVYFQARALALKTERLAFEQTRRHRPLPATPEVRFIEPVHVRAMVVESLLRVRHVKAKLGITKIATQRAVEPDRTPTDVFRSIVQASRQVNLLSRHGFAPSDVYTQVTHGISLAARLLSLCPGARRIPRTPDFEPARRPPDVYRRLLATQERIRLLAERSGVAILRVRAPDVEVDRASPSDVYDIASLVISELAHLHGLVSTLAAPVRRYDPGAKEPAQVFQRAGILERQVDRLDDCLASTGYRFEVN